MIRADTPAVIAIRQRLARAESRINRARSDEEYLADLAIIQSCCEQLAQLMQEAA